MLIWKQGGGKEGGGSGETEGEKERGREAQAQENRRGEGLDTHFRIPPCFFTPAPLCDATLPNCD